MRPIEDPPDTKRLGHSDANSSFSNLFAFLQKPLTPSASDPEKTTGSMFAQASAKKTYRKNARKLFFKDKANSFSGWLLVNGWFVVDASMHVQHSAVHKGYSYDGSLASNQLVLRQVRSSFRFCETARYQTRNTLDLVRYELSKLTAVQEPTSPNSPKPAAFVEKSEYVLPMSLEQAIQRVRNVLLSLQAARDQLLNIEARDRLERNENEFLFLSPPCPEEIRFEVFLNGPSVVATCYAFSEKSNARKSMHPSRSAMRPHGPGFVRPMSIGGKIVHVSHTLEASMSVDYIAEYIKFLDEAFGTALIIKNVFDTLKSLHDACHT